MNILLLLFISIQTLNLTQNKFSENNAIQIKKKKMLIDIKTYELENFEFLYDKFNWILILSYLVT